MTKETPRIAEFAVTWSRPKNSYRRRFSFLDRSNAQKDIDKMGRNGIYECKHYEIKGTAVSLVAGLICFYLKLDLLKIFVIVGVARLIAYCLIHWNIMLPLLPSIGRIYNRTINWFILPLDYPDRSRILHDGMASCSDFYSGIIFGWILEYVILFAWGRKMYKQFGFSFTQSEYAFIMAYRYFATKDGKPMDITDADSKECELSYWIEAYKDYEQTHPNRATTSIKEYADKNGYTMSS